MRLECVEGSVPSHCVCTENILINGREEKSNCAPWFKQAVMACKIKMYVSSEVSFQTHTTIMRNLTIYTDILPSSCVAVADIPRADLDHFDPAVKQAVSIFGFTGNGFWNCNDD